MVPFFVKVGVIGSCVMNIIILTLCFTVLKFYTVEMEFTFLGQQTEFLGLLTFDMTVQINMIWESGAGVLVLMIVVFSCMWPVVKNLVLIGLFVVPQTVVSKHTRHTALDGIDAVGRLSTVDCFIVIILVSALKIYFTGQRIVYLDILPADVVAIDLNAKPETGIVMLTFVAFYSLVVNHVVIYYHEKAEHFDRVETRQEKKLSPVDWEKDSNSRFKVSLFDWKLSEIAPNGLASAKIKPKAQQFLKFFPAVTGLFLLIGQWVPLMHIKYKGAIGSALAFVDDPILTDRIFSLIQFGTFLSEAAHNNISSQLSILFFQILYFLSVVIAPICVVTFYTVLYYVPMTLKEQKVLRFWALIATFWASTEVFLVSLVMGSVEFHTISAYMLDYVTNGSCGAAEPLLGILLGGENAACADMAGTMQATSLFTFVGTFLVSMYGLIMLRICSVKIRDREFFVENCTFEDVDSIGPLEYYVWINLVNADVKEKMKLDKTLRKGKAAHDKKARKQKRKNKLNNQSPPQSSGLTPIQHTGHLFQQPNNMQLANPSPQQQKPYDFRAVIAHQTNQRQALQQQRQQQQQQHARNPGFIPASNQQQQPRLASPPGLSLKNKAKSRFSVDV